MKIKKKKGPLYQRIIQDVVKKIHDGDYIPGEKLPGMRAFAAEYNASIQVVHHAMHNLAGSGNIIIEPHRGIYVSHSMQVGSYRRIGMFVQRLNLSSTLAECSALFRCCIESGYDLLLGNDFETETGLGEWLSQTGNLDALILGGAVTEATAKEAIRSGLVYRIWGNYDLPDSYPQYRISMSPFQDVFQELLRPYPGKKVFCMVGNPDSHSDQTMAAAMIAGANAAGLSCGEENVLYAWDDGYTLLAERYSKEKPDILLSVNRIANGIIRYFELNPGEPRPIVLACSDYSFTDPYKIITRRMKLPALVALSARDMLDGVLSEVRERYEKRAGVNCRSLPRVSGT